MTAVGNHFLDGIKTHIRNDCLPAAERELHRILIDKEFTNFWGRKDLPVLWGYIAHIKLDPSVGTAQVDLRNGRMQVSPQFILDNIETLEDLLFIILHERDHILLRRIYSIDWYILRKVLDFNENAVCAIRNVLEDAWINASVRSTAGIRSALPERFYCWRQEHADNPLSGFDPNVHTVGEPIGEEKALLTCLSPFVDQDIKRAHEGLYVDAASLLKNNGLKPGRIPERTHYTPYSQYEGKMLSFPEWYALFCEWLKQHKDDLEMPSPDCKGDADCPVHGDQKPEDKGNEGDEGKGEDGKGKGEDGEGDGKGEGNGGEGDGKPGEDHEHGGTKPCTCRGGNGLLNDPMDLAERLSRILTVSESGDDIEYVLKPEEEDNPQPLEVYEGGSGWSTEGHRLTPKEIVPQEIEDLDDFERGLLELGGSVLTDSHKTETVLIKGAVKRYADALVQNIATMRVTEHKILRPDFNMPLRPTRKDMMRLGMGEPPPTWETPQYIEQQELVVYTDVSGSMNMWYSVALYLTKQLREFGCESYQFSTIVVKPVPGRDDNVFWGTGGTRFNTVVDHIKLKGFQSVIFITDNEASLTEDRIAFLRDEIAEVYCVFLSKHNRPTDLDVETYSWGGRCGRRGFQHTTDNITAIFKSDIGKK